MVCVLVSPKLNRFIHPFSIKSICNLETLGILYALPCMSHYHALYFVSDRFHIITNLNTLIQSSISLIKNIQA